MLSYPATIPLSSRTLNHLADRIRGHRQQRRSLWRRLEHGRQALLALAHLRNGDTYTRLAAGFQIGVATAWRYVQEAISLLRGTKAPAEASARRSNDVASGPSCPGGRRAVNRAHAKIRARGERAIATLKTWRILVKLRCCPRRATAIVQAILVLHHVESPRYEG
ncbi:hypothetical protein HEP86_36595 [Streptomyces sp. RPA4-5]|nr:hypothetical protein HEP86_36595 [Streptomyces sp. RPA4-5]